MKHSDYSLIPTFVAIMQTKNYSKAAKQLGISQSAVSQGVTRLRDVFKDTLFIRASHGVEPTQFAHDIYPALANAVENIIYTLPEYQKFDPAECDKEFVVSSLSVFGFNILPELAMLMSQQAPQASVRIEPLKHIDQTDMLRSQQYDLLISAGSDYRGPLRSQVIMCDQLNIICRTDHPRLESTINEQQFLTEKHVTLGILGQDSDRHANYLIGQGFTNEALFKQRKTAWQASSIMEILPIVERSDYLSLLPQKLVNKYMDIYNLKTLKAPFMEDLIDVCTYWHSSRTNDPSHKWFRGLVAQAAKNVSKQLD
ncbi:LysR family transcriptional regulator [Shewanella sp. WXL01]|uniref:LysR family transcriptional regulator n=1 Tax=Shewanella sp. WXL01 TaxID=2709721 RepID=UPI0014382D42|nr:LysR family transcriptional regulator [Shewanella sp. WXL01]NKF50853.1 LysR family transcriptional regulator [Shewanella sp. WXL01]